jgi:hypothetical protein
MQATENGLRVLQNFQNFLAAAQMAASQEPAQQWSQSVQLLRVAYTL